MTWSYGVRTNVGSSSPFYGEERRPKDNDMRMGLHATAKSKTRTCGGLNCFVSACKAHPSIHHHSNLIRWSSTIATSSATLLNKHIFLKNPPIHEIGFGFGFRDGWSHLLVLPQYILWQQRAKTYPNMGLPHLPLVDHSFLHKLY